MAVESLAWPSAPASTDLNDGSQSYNMGILFGIASGGTSTTCVGVEWRVPDTVAAPAGGTHAVALWAVSGSLRLAYKEFTPVPGGYQQVLFDSPVTIAVATEYVASVYTNHYVYRSFASSGWHIFSPSGNIDAYSTRLASSNAGSVLAPIPDSNQPALYYAAPLTTVPGGGTTPVSSSLDTRWRVLNQVSSALDTRWKVSNVVSSALDTRWKVANVVSSALDTRWRVLNAVSSALDTRWVVVSTTTTVSSSLDTRWIVRSVVSSALDTRWAVRSIVSADLDTRWAVRSVVASALDTRWAVLSTVAAGLDTRWIVRNEVSAPLDTRWAVRSIVASSIDTRWAVLGVVSATLDTRWAVRLGVSASLDTRWRVFAQVSSGLTVLWVVQGAPLTADRLPVDAAGSLTERFGSDLEPVTAVFHPDGSIRAYLGAGNNG